MLALLTRVSAWLTPARRQAVYLIVLGLGALVVAVSPALSSQVTIWLKLIVAGGVVGSLVLGSIVTRSVVWTAVYRALGILVAALTTAGILSGAHADLVMQVGAQFGTLVPMLAILLRTDTTTVDGTPAAEVVPVAPVEVPPAPTPIVVANANRTVTSTDAAGVATTV